MTNKEKGAVLITGASTGIGRECALLLDQKGYKVFAGVRKTEDGQNLRQGGSGQIIPVKLDITDPIQISKAAEKVSEVLGPEQKLVSVVNNAGIVVAGAMEFLPLDDLRRQLEVNVIGQVAVTQAFLALIRKGRGRIIYVGSAVGRVALPFSCAYAASKFAMEGISDALRRELRPWGIKVILIQPGFVATPIYEKSFNDVYERESKFPPEARELYATATASMEGMMRKGRQSAMTPEFMAKKICKALEARKPKTRYPVGSDAKMAALSRFMPDWVVDWFLWKIMEKKIPSGLMGW